MFWVGTSLQQSCCLHRVDDIDSTVAGKLVFQLAQVHQTSSLSSWPSHHPHPSMRQCSGSHSLLLQHVSSCENDADFTAGIFNIIYTYITQTNQILPCIIFVLYKAVCFHTKCIHLYIYWLNKRLYIISSANTRLTPFRASRLFHF